MKSLRSFSLLAAVAAALVVAPAAQAADVNFTTSGVFGNGASTIEISPGNFISFAGRDGLVDASPSSQTSFGTFSTDFASQTPINVSTTFTLTIGLLPPTGLDPLDTIDFAANVTGTLSFDSSGAYVQFNDLDGTLNSTIGPILFQIVSAVINPDGSTTPGRLNLSPVSDPTGGESILLGRITVTAIPEPASFVLMGLAAPVVVLYRRRRATVA